MQLLDQPEGVLDSFPRPYIIGKIVDESQTVDTNEYNGVKVTMSELKTTWKWSYPLGHENLGIPTKKRIDHYKWWYNLVEEEKKNEFSLTDPHQQNIVDWKKPNDLDAIMEDKKDIDVTSWSHPELPAAPPS